MATNYYDENAQAFFKSTSELDVSELYVPFLQMVPAGGYILDAGCGSGRDARAFLGFGYTVEAFDPSASMCALATAHAGISVKQDSFQTLNYDQQFDGIWACASLLHVPLSQLPDTFARLRRALKQTGVLYCSFKFGSGEEVRNGRLFVDLNEEMLGDIVDGANFHLQKCWRTQDIRPGRQSETWLNALCARKKR